MAENQHLTSSGLFNAFKASNDKAKRQSCDEDGFSTDDFDVTPGQIQVIRRTGEVEKFNAEKIADALSRAFAAIEDSGRHTKELVAVILKRGEITDIQFEHTINEWFYKNLFSLKGLVKLTAASNALSLFKKFKEINSSISFTTTRNFSIEKNLSISA